MIPQESDLRTMSLLERLEEARKLALVEDKESIELAVDRIKDLEAKLNKAKEWAQLQIAHPGCLPDAKALLKMLED